jgi:hypothetical protein
MCVKTMELYIYRKIFRTAKHQSTCYCSVCYRETLYVTYIREKLMWDQCAGAHEIPSAHEIEGIGAKEFFTV